MSHLARLVACCLCAPLACSSPKAPETTAAAPGSELTAPSDPAPKAPDPPPAPASPAPASPAPEPSVSAAENGPRVQTLFVRERRVPCQGEAPMQCLQVRGAEEAEWRNFYANIDGFTYEDAHAYELRVEVTPIAQPPADAPAVRYRLVEVVSKRNVDVGPGP